MSDHPSPAEAESDRGSTFAEAMSTIRRILVDGLDHGFFEASLTIETRKAGKRELLVKAGKSHKFTIPLDEVPR